MSCEEYDKKKSMGENVRKIYILMINEKMFFCYINAHSHKNYMHDGFI